MNLFGRMLVAVAGAGMVAGCNDTGKAEQVVVPPSNILPEKTVTPASVTLFPGDTVQLRVADGQAARWRSSNPSLGDVDSLTGVVRAKATGSVTVTARMVADTNVKGAAAVQITPRP